MSLGRRPAPSLAKALLALALAGPLAASPPSEADREAFAAGHRSALEAAAAQRGAARPKASQADVDVVSYDLSLFLDLARERIEGRCAITFVTAAGSASADELVLDLDSAVPPDGSGTGHVVGLVERDGSPLDPSRVVHSGGVLRIRLDPPLPEGAPSSTVTVRYAGRPAELSFGTMTFDVHGDPPAPVVFTLSEPFLGRGWWPSKDVPDDKALVTVRVEAPDGLTVVSNGVQLPLQPGRPGHSITTWRSSYPVSTYLVSVAASNYETWTDTYTSLDGTVEMPVTHWAYPEIAAAAREDWSPTVPMIETFADRFGEYPFLAEKYGHASIPLWGAMEHQTATSYGSNLITGDHRFDFVVAHELAHQWWGDLVGPRTFESIWLNEGLATWSEALWYESIAGRSGYLDYMRSLDPMPFRGTDFTGTVHAPDELFGDTVYRKGAWVVHMLRWVLSQPAPDGDPAAVLAVLRAHATSFAYSSAATSDFEATAEAEAGRSLRRFFDQWVHRPGRPLYAVGWSASAEDDGSFTVHLRVRQDQPVPFEMPVLVRMSLPSGTREVVVANDSALADYTFAVPERPSGVEWDPDGWILKAVTVVDVDADADGWPEWLDGCPSVPNPEQEDLDADGVQDACQVGLDADGDGTPNEDDCAPADDLAWADPEGDTVLHVERRGAEHVITLAHPPAAGQREPVGDVASGRLDDLRSDRSTARALCIAAGHASGELVDASAPVPGGRYFLAWPWNGCGPADSACR